MSTVKRSRAERAAQTRRRMVAAAYELFCEQGFRSTTMAAVAERAGVAVQTLYFTFGTKDALLQAVQDWAVLGDEAVVPPLQPAYLAAQAASDPRETVRHIVHHSAIILARVAPLVPVFHAVSADPAGQTYRYAEDLRRQAMHDLARETLAVRASWRAGMDTRRAGDLLIVLTSPETYRSFVVDLGWSPDRWEAWTVDALMYSLYGPG